MADLQNTTITDTGFVKFQTGGTSTRGTPQAGSIRFNTDLGIFEWYSGSVWIGGEAKEDKNEVGNSSTNPAESGWDLIRERPNIPNGYYWIQSPTMTSPREMYVDTVYDGGGYDFLPLTGQTSVTDVRSGNGATALGLQLVYPRSPNHWIAMSDFTNNVLDTSIETYFSGFVGPIYRRWATSGGTAGGNYTGQIMRSTLGYGSGAQDWQVPDGGRWWLRNSTYSEPNGDYGEYGFLARRGITNPYNGDDITFNDGGSAGNRPYATGGSYIASTNKKP